jgi:hypothetical protein
MESKSNFGSFYKVVVFSGKKKDLGKTIFHDKANVKGYDDIRLGKLTIPNITVVINIKDDAGKELLRIREKNASGYSNLIISMHTEESGGMLAFNTIRNSKSKDYEKGSIEII